MSDYLCCVCCVSYPVRLRFVVVCRAVWGHPSGAGSVWELWAGHQAALSERGVRKRSGTSVITPSGPPFNRNDLLICVFVWDQVIECLKEKKKQLTQQCHQKVFKLQENEMMDPELDFQLMRVCKQMIRVWNLVNYILKHPRVKWWLDIVWLILNKRLNFYFIVYHAALLQWVGCEEHVTVSQTKQEQRANGPEMQTNDYQETDHPEHRYNYHYILIYTYTYSGAFLESLTYLSSELEAANQLTGSFINAMFQKFSFYDRLAKGFKFISM